MQFRNTLFAAGAGAAAPLAYAMWMVWSVLVVRLPAAGFDYSTNQLFLLAALPGLSGATLRLFYAVMMPVFGGRKWAAVTTAALVVPALGIGIAVQQAGTGYPTMLALALLCGVGGGNLAAAGSGRDGVLGVLGAPLAQLLAPLAISGAVAGAAGGPALQNAGFIWVLPILLCAWLIRRAPASPRAVFAEQAVIFRRRHNWIMCWLCAGAFGSFIGHAAGFPLLLQTEFPAVDSLGWAFLGPLAGVLAGAAGARLAARLGAARVALGAFCLMAGAVLGVLACLPRGGGGSFAGLFAVSMLLFAAAGVATAATTRMIAPLFGGAAGNEAAAVTAFTSALAAYGAFFIPKSYGSAIALSGSPAPALWCFAAFYASCIAITWRCYLAAPRAAA